MADNFDPDAYLGVQNHQTGGFDPDAYLGETGLFGQELKKPIAAGWEQSVMNKQFPAPTPMHSTDPSDPTSAAFEASPNYPPARMTDPSIQDAMAVQGAYGLGKTAIGAAGKGIGMALDAIPATENLVPTIERVANNQTLKSLGGTMGQLNRMSEGAGGREALDTAATYARDKGLSDVFSTSIGRDKQLASLLKSSGKTLGDLRKEAGPAQPGVLEKVAADVSKKYGPKALRSAEAPAVTKTLESVKEMSGETPAVEQDLPVIKPGSKTGEPHALFGYNDNTGPGGTPESHYTAFGDPAHPVFQMKSPRGIGGYGTTGTKADMDALGIPITGREPRSVGRWEPLDLGTPGTPPTHAGYAQAATNINDFAAGNKVYQPVTAETDVANALSRENNQGIVQSLGSDKGKKYLGALEEQTRLHPLEHLMKRGELREMGGRGGLSMGKSFIQKIADSMGYRMTAKTMAGIHKLLAADPNLSEVLQNTSKTVPASFMESKYGRK